MADLISIVTPVYNEEETLIIYYNTIQKELFDKIDVNFEVLFVDDGSTDNSWEIIKSISCRDNRFKGIRLSRNLGSHIALTAVFKNAIGAAVATLACDLQDPPSLIIEFIKKWHEGFHVVWGVKKNRKDKIWKIFTSKTFEYLLRKYVMPANSKFSTGSFLLIDHKVLSYYNRFKESNRITFAIVAVLGFKQFRVYYSRSTRLLGKSGWNFSKMVKTMFDAIVSFSYSHVRLIALFSIISIIIQIPFIIYTIYLFASNRTSNIGWISTILSITFFSSLILLNLVLILEYLIRIYSNTAQRPLYFIEDTTNITINSDEN